MLFSSKAPEKMLLGKASLPCPVDVSAVQLSRADAWSAAERRRELWGQQG